MFMNVCSPCVYFTLMELNVSSPGLITIASVRLVPVPGAPALIPCVPSCFRAPFPTVCPPVPGAVNGWGPGRGRSCLESPPCRPPSAASQGRQPLCPAGAESRLRQG